MTLPAPQSPLLRHRPLARSLRAVTATAVCLALATFALFAASTTAHAAASLLSQGHPTTASSVEKIGRASCRERV